MNGNGPVKVCFGSAHFDCDGKALQHFVGAQALHVQAHHLQDRRRAEYSAAGMARKQNLRAEFLFYGLRSDHGHHRSLENAEPTYLLLLADTHQLHDAQALPGGDGVVHRSERSLVDLHVLLSPRFVGLLCEEDTGLCNLDSCALCYNIFSINYVCQMK